MGGTTNYPRGLSSQGVRLLGEGIAATFGNAPGKGSGKYIFVNPTNGSNKLSGLTFSRRKKTLTNA